MLFFCVAVYNDAAKKQANDLTENMRCDLWLVDGLF